MDDVERMYRHLVHTIRTKFTPMLTQPFEVGELFQTILPYRLHRRELGLQSNHDYEMVLLELLAGPRGYLVVDDRMRDTLAVQLAASTPDPAVIRDFACSTHRHAPRAPRARSARRHRAARRVRTASAAARSRWATPRRRARRRRRMRRRAAPPSRSWWRRAITARSATASCPTDDRSVSARTAART